MIARTKQLLGAAQRAVEHGLYVFPVVPRGKTPAITNWERRATRNQRQILSWWTKPFNLGVAAGRSSLVVIDLDVAHHEQPPPEFASARSGRDVLVELSARAGHPAPFDTRTVTTPSGGLHLYYRAPEGLRLRSTTGTLGWKIDTRAWGGFVVGAGSIGRHNRYRVTNGAPVADLPEWLAAALTPPASEPHPATSGRVLGVAPDRVTAYLAAIIDDETSTLEAAAVGTRHTTRLAAARTLGRLVGGGELTEGVAFAHLWQAARQHIGHDCTEREVLRDLHDGLEFGRRLPRRIGLSDS